MAAPLSRKLALVTGASSGIGAAFAELYAARGYDLALVARRADRLEALAQSLKDRRGVDAYAIPVDLARPDAEQSVFAALGSVGRSVDILVNNAGFGVPKTFVATPWTAQRDFLMTLAVTPCALAYGVIPGMIQAGGGGIINVASIAAFSPGVGGNTLYPGVKSLMVKFSEALDAEYREKGVRITALCPGSTKTAFAAEAGIQAVVDKAPRLLSQTAEAVALAGADGNDRGRLLVIPGWHNKLAVALMRSLPHGLVRAVVNAGAAPYRLET